jgi:hypothetical protein
MPFGTASAFLPGMTSIAAFLSVPGIPTGGDSMVEGSGAAAAGTVPGTRTARILGIESAIEAHGGDSAPEPESFESNLNHMMESLNAGLDKAAETDRQKETAPSPFVLSEGNERVSGAGVGIRNRTEGVVIRTALRSVGAHRGRAANHPERLRANQADDEKKSALTGARGNSGTESPPDASAFLMMPAGSGAAGKQGSMTREGLGASLDTQRGRVSDGPTLWLADSAQPDNFKEEIAANGTEISKDGSNPIALPDQAIPDRLLRPEPNLGYTARGESLVQAAQDAPSSAGAAEPSASIEPVEARSLPLHASPQRVALKGASPQDLNGRPSRHATHADGGGEMERENASVGLAAQQAMDPGRTRDAAVAGGQVEQGAYKFNEAVRPSTSASYASAASDPFSALDSDQAGGSMNWIHAGAHRAEAGYLDPALGWVSVRAGAVGGGIHAAVVPGSPEAAQVLGGHMTGLSSHLAQQHGNTATVTLAPAQEVWDSQGWSSQTAGGDRGAERQSAGSGNETRQTVTDQPARSGNMGSGATRTNMLVPGRSGSTISVMA